jgi:2'-5' RNA ligase
MIKLGVFYCLDSVLKNNVESIKSSFETKSRKNKYLNHLAHSTFYVFNIESKKMNEVIEKFESLQKVLSPISSQITKWRVFERDILTGLNTLCLEIENTNGLKLLQLNVVDSLCKFHSREKNIGFNGDLKFSNDKYGYPFVGDHWIPHITIGSLDIDKKKLTDFSEGMFNFPREIKINNLGLFKIETDSHYLIKRIEF